MLCLFYYVLCRGALRCVGGVDAVDKGITRRPCGFVPLLAIGGFVCSGDGADELDEAIAVALGGYGGDLGLGVCETFEEMLHPFDNRVLSPVSRHSCIAKFGRTYMSQTIDDTQVVNLLSWGVILVGCAEATVV